MRNFQRRALDSIKASGSTAELTDALQAHYDAIGQGVPGEDDTT